MEGCRTVENKQSMFHWSQGVSEKMLAPHANNLTVYPTLHYISNTLPLSGCFLFLPIYLFHFIPSRFYSREFSVFSLKYSVKYVATHLVWVDLCIFWVLLKICIFRKKITKHTCEGNLLQFKGRNAKYSQTSIYLYFNSIKLIF